MTTDLWANITTNYAKLYGISNDSMLLLISLLISIGVGVFLAVELKNKHLGFVGFFMTFGITAFLGFINWLYFIIPLIVVGALLFYLHEKESA